LVYSRTVHEHEHTRRVHSVCSAEFHPTISIKTHFNYKSPNTMRCLTAGATHPCALKSSSTTSLLPTRHTSSTVRASLSTGVLQLIKITTLSGILWTACCWHCCELGHPCTVLLTPWPLWIAHQGQPIPAANTAGATHADVLDAAGASNHASAGAPQHSLNLICSMQQQHDCAQAACQSSSASTSSCATWQHS
jgi:hypothetical protein